MTTTPILLIPGLNCTGRVYAGQISALWGYGPITLANHLEGEGMAGIAAAILAAAPPRFALAGFSMGGYLAFEILRQARERVLGLALLDTSARPDTPEQSRLRRMRMNKAESADFAAVLSEQYAQLVHESRTDDRALQELHRAMGEAAGREAFIRHQDAIIARPDSRPELAAIACPTLVLVGDGDRVTPPDLAREMAAGITGARLEIIPEAGHLAPLERPDAVARALAGWLETVAAAP